MKTRRMPARFHLTAGTAQDLVAINAIAIYRFSERLGFG